MTNYLGSYANCEACREVVSAEELKPVKMSIPLNLLLCVHCQIMDSAGESVITELTQDVHIYQTTKIRGILNLQDACRSINILCGLLDAALQYTPYSPDEAGGITSGVNSLVAAREVLELALASVVDWKLAEWKLD